MLLVTAFEAFGDRRQNSSSLCLDRFREFYESSAKDGPVEFEILPVCYTRMPEVLNRLVESFAPTRIVCLGEAASAQSVRLEELACNRDESIKPDNAGLVRAGEIIIPGGESVLATGLGIDAMETRLRCAGVPTERSRDAGGFLCNHAFYLARTRVAHSGFVHVPLDIPAAWFAPLWRAIVEDA